MPDARLPSGWKQTNLAGLADYINGFAFNESYWSAEGLPIVRIAQITGSQGIVDRYKGSLPDAYRLEDWNLIFSWSGTLAVVRWNGGPAWLNQHLFKVVPRSDVDRDLLFHLLQASVAEMDKRSHGSTMKHIKRGELREFDVTLPVDAAEQRGLANVLDTLDITIRQTEAIIEKLKQVKQGLLHDLLTRGIDANGELRPPQSQAPHLYKDSPLGWIPREWQVVPAVQACEAVIDCKNRTPPETTSGHPVIRTPNVRDGRFVRSGLAYTDSLSYSIWTERGRPRKGDVLITREAPVGEVCLLPEDMTDACLGQRMMMYRPDPNVLTSNFMLIALLSSAVQKSLLDLAGGSTVGHVKVGDIRRLRIPVPSVCEQGKIVQAYGATEEWLASEQALRAKLKQQKSGLMDDLLTGRVRVTPLLQGSGQSPLEGNT